MAKRKATAPKKSARNTASKPAAATRGKLADDVLHRRIRAITADWSRDLPKAAVSSGAFDFTDKENRVPAIDAKGVPDGRYRVDGSDWILTVKGEQVVLAEKGSANLSPEGIVPVPSL